MLQYKILRQHLYTTTKNMHVIWYDTAYTVLIYKFTESIRALAAPFTAEPALKWCTEQK